MNGSSRVVLIVDDKPNMLRLLTKVLSDDVQVRKAETGAEALLILEREPIDVVLCDLKMPDMEGIDVLRTVRRLWPACEFILMTAYASVPTAVEALRLGAYDYLTKPFAPDDARAVVLRALSRTRARSGTPEHDEGLPEGPFVSRATRPAPTPHEEFTSSSPLSSVEPVPVGESQMSGDFPSWSQALERGRSEAAKQYLEALLRRCNGQVPEASALARVERESLYRLLRRHGVDPDAFRKKS